MRFEWSLRLWQVGSGNCIHELDAFDRETVSSGTCQPKRASDTSAKQHNTLAIFYAFYPLMIFAKRLALKQVLTPQHSRDLLLCLLWASTQSGIGENDRATSEWTSRRPSIKEEISVHILAVLLFVCD